MLDQLVSELLQEREQAQRETDRRAALDAVHRITGPKSEHWTRRYCTYVELCQALDWYARDEGKAGGTNTIQNWTTRRSGPSPQNLYLVTLVADGALRLEFAPAEGGVRREGTVYATPEFVEDVWKACLEESPKRAARIFTIWRKLTGAKLTKTKQWIKLELDGRLVAKLGRESVRKPWSLYLPGKRKPKTQIRKTDRALAVLAKEGFRAYQKTRKSSNNAVDSTDPNEVGSKVSGG